MNAIKLLLSLSLSGSAVLLALVAFRPLLRRLGKTWQYYIWLVVVARLLLPVALPVNLVGGLFTAPASVTPSVQTEWQARHATETAAPEAAPESTQVPAPAPAGWSVQMLLPVWAAVALALFVRKVTDYQGFVRFIKAGLKPPDDEALEENCARACRGLGLSKQIPIYVNPLAPSPMLVGLFHPFIVTPDAAACGVPVLLHELTHFKRLDAAYKWALELVVCLHWFNPLVYLLRREAGRACELSCDEAVLRALEPEDHVAYGNALLEAAKGGGYKSVVAPVALEGDAKFLKERLGEIMRFQNRGRRIGLPLLMAALVTAGAMICGCAVLAAPKTQEKPKEATSEPFVFDEKADVFENGRNISTTFFRNKYILQISWNAKPSKAAAQRSVTVDGNAYTLLFDETTKQYADDEGVLEAARQSIGAILAKDWSKWGGKRISTPLISQVAGPYTQSGNELAEKFYQEKNIAFFAAVSDEADQATKKRLAEKSAEAGEVAYLSVVADDLNAATQKRLAKQALADGAVAIFSTLSDVFSQAEQAELAKQAFHEENVAIFSMLSDALSKEERAQLLRQAVADGRVAEVGILADELSEAEQGKLARQAYANGDIAVFSALSEALSETEQAQLAKQAFRDGDVAIFSMLSDTLSQMEQANMAKQAFEDGNVAMFSILYESMSQAEQANYAKRAFEKRDIAMFSMLMDALSKEERAQLAKQARDNDMAFYYMLSDDS